MYACNFSFGLGLVPMDTQSLIFLTQLDTNSLEKFASLHGGPFYWGDFTSDKESMHRFNFFYYVVVCHEQYCDCDLLRTSSVAFGTSHI